MTTTTHNIDAFNFSPGRKVGSRYVIESFIGGGWEGEVYRVVDPQIGVQRAAKIFYPQRNANDRAVKFYARKLDRLRHCRIVTQYAHNETMRYHDMTLTCLISEFVEGEVLRDFLSRQPGKRLRPFEAMHLLHAMTLGIMEIHDAGEYHGDLHSENFLVTQRGIHFDVKLIDFFDYGRPTAGQRREDVIQLVQLLHEFIGGRKWYAKMPPELKSICLGLRRDLIGKKFPTIHCLKSHLESFQWKS